MKPLYSPNSEIPIYPTDTDVEVDELGTWPATIHRFDLEAATALRAAEATGRPLLIRGSPGVGKSHTARAAASFAQRPFLSIVIDGRAEPHDLMWRFDAIRRLGDAQIGSENHLVKSELHYLSPQALWWAYGWNSARDQVAKLVDKEDLLPHAPPAWDSTNDRTVLLIDEIDKADPDLPNALLEVLANKGFRIPFGGGLVRCSDKTRPLVVITTNEERELPNAFLRRCLVLVLELPKHELLAEFLVGMGTRHQEFLLKRRKRTGRCLVMPQAAQLLLRARQDAMRAGEYLPGTSEYLDLVGALSSLWPNDEEKQRSQLELLAEFSLKKSAKQNP